MARGGATGIALAAAMLTVGCGSSSDPDRALACSMVLRDQWVEVRSEWNPRGIPTRRLTPEDRARVRDDRLWRTLVPGPEFEANRAAACGGRARSDMRALAVSRDGQWARAEFVQQYQAEICLARREGERWRERECDITMIADPEMEIPSG